MVDRALKKFNFIVREELGRNKIYQISASSKEEAEDLLDGFKQKPVEIELGDDKEDVTHYNVLECFEETN